MPHITLLYPFRPREEFDRVAGPLGDRAADVRPFDLQLATFDAFRHGRRSFTMWLRPEPADRVVALQAALLSAMPDCDDVNRYPEGFRPHLSVGQCRSEPQLRELLARLQSDFEPVRFTVDSVAIIWRIGRPDDPFQVDRMIPLTPPPQEVGPAP